jgi:hypothetical protein
MIRRRGNQYDEGAVGSAGICISGSSSLRRMTVILVDTDELNDYGVEQNGE